MIWKKCIIHQKKKTIFEKAHLAGKSKKRYGKRSFFFGCVKDGAEGERKYKCTKKEDGN